MKMKTKTMLGVIVLFGLILSSCSKDDNGFANRRYAVARQNKFEAEAKIKEEEQKAKEIEKAADPSSNISSNDPNQSLNPPSLNPPLDGSGGPSSTSSLPNIPPPPIELHKCSTIRLYTDGKTYCSYKTENSSKFALVATKYEGEGWMLPKNHFDKLPVGSFYMYIDKVVDQTNKIHVKVICKKDGDTLNHTVKEAKFIRSKPNDNSNDEWIPDSDGFQ